MQVASVLCSALLAATSLVAQTGDIGAPPGRLVDIGGRKLHVYCSGSGSPTVVLEAGAGAFAIDWSPVQPEIAHNNRVCSYDRAGYGWSDASKAVETPANVVLDLHAALQAAGEKSSLRHGRRVDGWHLRSVVSGPISYRGRRHGAGVSISRGSAISRCSRERVSQ